MGEIKVEFFKVSIILVEAEQRIEKVEEMFPNTENTVIHPSVRLISYTYPESGCGSSNLSRERLGLGKPLGPGPLGNPRAPVCLIYFIFILFTVF